MRESRPYGSVRGARDETRVPTATATVLLRLLTAASGTKRTYPRRLLFVRFRGEADVHDRLASTSSVVDDLKRTFAGHFCWDARPGIRSAEDKLLICNVIV
jgi:hypothetical protein